MYGREGTTSTDAFMLLIKGLAQIAHTRGHEREVEKRNTIWLPPMHGSCHSTRLFIESGLLIQALER